MHVMFSMFSHEITHIYKYQIGQIGPWQNSEMLFGVTMEVDCPLSCPDSYFKQALNRMCAGLALCSRWTSAKTHQQLFVFKDQC
jgi:hypothetical protein